MAVVETLAKTEAIKRVRPQTELQFPACPAETQSPRGKENYNCQRVPRPVSRPESRELQFPTCPAGPRSLPRQNYNSQRVPSPGFRPHPGRRTTNPSVPRSQRRVARVRRTVARAVARSLRARPAVRSPAGGRFPEPGECARMEGGMDGRMDERTRLPGRPMTPRVRGEAGGPRGAETDGGPGNAGCRASGGPGRRQKQAGPFWKVPGGLGGLVGGGAG